MQALQSNNCQIVFQDSGMEQLNRSIQEGKYASLFILVDQNTKRDCLPHFLKKLQVSQVPEVLVMEPGEEHKNLSTCQNLWEALSEKQGDRKSALINLGGGVVTDLGGFVAACFKRGIAFYNVPTTLLSMVDASVGGKTGIDLGMLKNQVGIITDPKMVLIDPVWLSTLSKEEIRSGFAEMLKHGLIAAPEYWSELSQLAEVDAVLITHSIRTSIEIKNKVVIEDPFENGLRKILNFGHTLGHAIESYFLIHKEKKTLLHGEAIAIGMVLETYLSTQVCGLDPVVANEIKAVFANFYTSVTFSDSDINALLQLLQHDKKNSHGKINFVLLEAIGRPKIDQQVPNALFKKAFDFYSKP